MCSSCRVMPGAAYALKGRLQVVEGHFFENCSDEVLAIIQRLRCWPSHQTVSNSEAQQGPCNRSTTRSTTSEAASWPSPKALAIKSPQE